MLEDMSHLHLQTLFKSSQSNASPSVIVSVQADEGEPLYPPQMITAMAQSVCMGGAAGLRLAGVSNIHAVRALLPSIPIIGITKPPKTLPDALSRVYITPTLQDALSLAEAGCDIVAMDATTRPRPGGESLEAIVKAFKQAYPNTLLMADLATLTDGLNAEKLGFDVLSTTLSGYTQETHGLLSPGPDYDLLQQLITQTACPVILEGRVWLPQDVQKAFSLGASAVVIGSAITRPHHITRRFVESLVSH
jgi:N-acylglucosamine-6-phosphate 2-epimerase